MGHSFMDRLAINIAESYFSCSSYLQIKRLILCQQTSSLVKSKTLKLLSDTGLDLTFQGASGWENNGTIHTGKIQAILYRYNFWYNLNMVKGAYFVNHILFFKNLNLIYCFIFLSKAIRQCQLYLQMQKST